MTKLKVLGKPQVAKRNTAEYNKQCLAAVVCNDYQKQTNIFLCSGFNCKIFPSKQRRYAASTGNATQLIKQGLLEIKTEGGKIKNKAEPKQAALMQTLKALGLKFLTQPN